MVDELSTRIAGEISLSENPSKTMKKWREIFGLSQTELARYIHITPSVVSDYESGRRKAPGANTIKRFVAGIMKADAERGYPVVKSYRTMLSSMDDDGPVVDMQDFKMPLSAAELCHAIEGDMVANRDKGSTAVYGYTVVDSIKAILELSSDDFLNLYGTTSQRALIFTKVSYGRSPLIAVRVSRIKPGVVVMHGIDKIDDLGMRIAERERIPVILTVMEQKRLLERLRGCGR